MDKTDQYGFTKEEVQPFDTLKIIESRLEVMERIQKSINNYA